MNSVAPSPDYAAVQDYLFSLKAQGLKFGVDRMRWFAAELGHPERSRPTLHVAGTNGKGSVSAMLESILRAAGWRTGLYTSPHLVRLGERVQVDRLPLAEEEITAYTAELRPAADRIAARVGEDDRPSFFEFMTAMAFLQFARRETDINVIEVGLGGRLDATNIVTPEVSIITSIGLDHCDMLGEALALIAAEKAGIIKPGRPVVIGRMPPEAEQVIRRIAAEKQAPLRSVADEFGPDIGGHPWTNLAGDYQRWNAATAVLALRLLSPLWRLNDEAIARGLGAVDWPGRWQRVEIGGRPAILDASHNPEGAEVLKTNLERLVAETGGRPIVITGALGARRAGPLLAAIAPYARELHLVVPHQARASSHDELEFLVPKDFRGPVVRSTVESLFPRPDACTLSGDDTFVVTGSIYLLGEVMSRLEPQRGPNEGRLQDF